jgi:hypothetical protein
VLRQHLVRVAGVEVGVVGIRLRRLGLLGLALGLVGDLVQDGNELHDEGLEVRPVRFFPQVGVGELGVGLLEDRVEVHRGLGRLLGAGLVGLLLLHVVLDLGGDLVELVDVGGKEQARLHRGVVDLVEDGGDVRAEALQPRPDRVGGLAVFRRVVALDQDDEARVGAEFLEELVVGRLGGRLVAEQVARVVHHGEAGGQDEDRAAGQHNGHQKDGQRRRGDHPRDQPHGALQNSVDDRHGERGN